MQASMNEFTQFLERRDDGVHQSTENEELMEHRSPSGREDSRGSTNHLEDYSNLPPPHTIDELVFEVLGLSEAEQNSAPTSHCIPGDVVPSGRSAVRTAIDGSNENNYGGQWDEGLLDNDYPDYLSSYSHEVVIRTETQSSSHGDKDNSDRLNANPNEYVLNVLPQEKLEGFQVEETLHMTSAPNVMSKNVIDTFQEESTFFEESIMGFDMRKDCKSYYESSTSEINAEESSEDVSPGCSNLHIVPMSNEMMDEVTPSPPEEFAAPLPGDSSIEIIQISSPDVAKVPISTGIDQPSSMSPPICHLVASSSQRSLSSCCGKYGHVVKNQIVLPYSGDSILSENDSLDSQDCSMPKLVRADDPPPPVADQIYDSPPELEPVGQPNPNSSKKGLKTTSSTLASAAGEELSKSTKKLTLDSVPETVQETTSLEQCNYSLCTIVPSFTPDISNNIPAYMNEIYSNRTTHSDSTCSALTTSTGCRGSLPLLPITTEEPKVYSTFHKESSISPPKKSRTPDVKTRNSGGVDKGFVRDLLRSVNRGPNSLSGPNCVVEFTHMPPNMLSIRKTVSSNHAKGLDSNQSDNTPGVVVQPVNILTVNDPSSPNTEFKSLPDLRALLDTCGVRSMEKVPSNCNSVPTLAPNRDNFKTEIICTSTSSSSSFRKTTTIVANVAQEMVNGVRVSVPLPIENMKTKKPIQINTQEKVVGFTSAKITSKKLKSTQEVKVSLPISFHRSLDPKSVKCKDPSDIPEISIEKETAVLVSSDTTKQPTSLKVAPQVPAYKNDLSSDMDCILSDTSGMKQVEDVNSLHVSIQHQKSTNYTSSGNELDKLLTATSNRSIDVKNSLNKNTYESQPIFCLSDNQKSETPPLQILEQNEMEQNDALKEHPVFEAVNSLISSSKMIELIYDSSEKPETRTAVVTTVDVERKSNFSSKGAMKDRTSQSVTKKSKALSLLDDAPQRKTTTTQKTDSQTTSSRDSGSKQKDISSKMVRTKSSLSHQSSEGKVNISTGVTIHQKLVNSVVDVNKQKRESQNGNNLINWQSEIGEKSNSLFPENVEDNESGSLKTSSSLVKTDKPSEAVVDKTIVLKEKVKPQKQLSKKNAPKPQIPSDTIQKQKMTSTQAEAVKSKTTLKVDQTISSSPQAVVDEPKTVSLQHEVGKTNMSLSKKVINKTKSSADCEGDKSLPKQSQLKVDETLALPVADEGKKSETNSDVVEKFPMETLQVKKILPAQDVTHVQDEQVQGPVEKLGHMHLNVVCNNNVSQTKKLSVDAKCVVDILKFSPNKVSNGKTKTELKPLKKEDLRLAAKQLASISEDVGEKKAAQVKEVVNERKPVVPQPKADSNKVVVGKLEIPVLQQITVSDAVIAQCTVETNNIRASTKPLEGTKSSVSNEVVGHSTPTSNKPKGAILKFVTEKLKTLRSQDLAKKNGGKCQHNIEKDSSPKVLVKKVGQNLNEVADELKLTNDKPKKTSFKELAEKDENSSSNDLSEKRELVSDKERTQILKKELGNNDGAGYEKVVGEIAPSVNDTKAKTASVNAVFDKMKKVKTEKYHKKEKVVTDGNSSLTSLGVKSNEEVVGMNRDVDKSKIALPKVVVDGMNIAVTQSVVESLEIVQDVTKTESPQIMLGVVEKDRNSGTTEMVIEAEPTGEKTIATSPKCKIEETNSTTQDVVEEHKDEIQRMTEKQSPPPLQKIREKKKGSQSVRGNVESKASAKISTLSKTLDRSTENLTSPGVAEKQQKQDTRTKSVKLINQTLQEDKTNCADSSIVVDVITPDFVDKNNCTLLKEVVVVERKSEVDKQNTSSPKVEINNSSKTTANVIGKFEEQAQNEEFHQHLTDTAGKRKTGQLGKVLVDITAPQSNEAIESPSIELDKQRRSPSSDDLVQESGTDPSPGKVEKKKVTSLNMAEKNLVSLKKSKCSDLLLGMVNARTTKLLQNAHQLLSKSPALKKHGRVEKGRKPPVGHWKIVNKGTAIASSQAMSQFKNIDLAQEQSKSRLRNRSGSSDRKSSANIISTVSDAKAVETTAMVQPLVIEVAKTCIGSLSDSKDENKVRLRTRSETSNERKLKDDGNLNTVVCEVQVDSDSLVETSDKITTKQTKETSSLKENSLIPSGTKKVEPLNKLLTKPSKKSLAVGIAETSIEDHHVRLRTRSETSCDKKVQDIKNPLNHCVKEPAKSLMESVVPKETKILERKTACSANVSDMVREETKTRLRTRSETTNEKNLHDDSSSLLTDCGINVSHNDSDQVAAVDQPPLKIVKEVAKVDGRSPARLSRYDSRLEDKHCLRTRRGTSSESKLKKDESGSRQIIQSLKSAEVVSKQVDIGGKVSVYDFTDDDDSQINIHSIDQLRNLSAKSVKNKRTTLVSGSTELSVIPVEDECKLNTSSRRLKSDNVKMASDRNSRKSSPKKIPVKKDITNVDKEDIRSERRLSKSSDRVQAEVKKMDESSLSSENHSGSKEGAETRSRIRDLENDDELSPTRVLRSKMKQATSSPAVNSVVKNKAIDAEEESSTLMGITSGQKLKLASKAMPGKAEYSSGKYDSTPAVNTFNKLPSVLPKNNVQNHLQEDGESSLTKRKTRSSNKKGEKSVQETSLLSKDNVLVSKSRSPVPRKSNQNPVILSSEEGGRLNDKMALKSQQHISDELKLVINRFRKPLQGDKTGSSKAADSEIIQKSVRETSQADIINQEKVKSIKTAILDAVCEVQPNQSSILTSQDNTMCNAEAVSLITPLMGTVESREPDNIQVLNDMPQDGEPEGAKSSIPEGMEQEGRGKIIFKRDKERGEQKLVRDRFVLNSKTQSTESFQNKSHNSIVDSLPGSKSVQQSLCYDSNIPSKILDSSKHSIHSITDGSSHENEGSPSRRTTRASHSISLDSSLVKKKGNVVNDSLRPRRGSSGNAIKQNDDMGKSPVTSNEKVLKEAHRQSGKRSQCQTENQNSFPCNSKLRKIEAMEKRNEMKRRLSNPGKSVPLPVPIVEMSSGKGPNISDTSNKARGQSGNIKEPLSQSTTSLSALASGKDFPSKVGLPQESFTVTTLTSVESMKFHQEEHKPEKNSSRRKSKTPLPIKKSPLIALKTTVKDVFLASESLNKILCEDMTSAFDTLAQNPGKSPDSTSGADIVISKQTQAPLTANTQKISEDSQGVTSTTEIELLPIMVTETLPTLELTTETHDMDHSKKEDESVSSTTADSKLCSVDDSPKFVSINEVKATRPSKQSIDKSSIVGNNDAQVVQKPSPSDSSVGDRGDLSPEYDGGHPRRKIFKVNPDFYRLSSDQKIVKVLSRENESSNIKSLSDEELKKTPLKKRQVRVDDGVGSIQKFDGNSQKVDKKPTNESKSVLSSSSSVNGNVGNVQQFDGNSQIVDKKPTSESKPTLQPTSSVDGCVRNIQQGDGNYQKVDKKPTKESKTMLLPISSVGELTFSMDRILSSSPPDKIPPTLQKADSRPVLEEEATSNPPDKIPATFQKADSRPLLKEKKTSNPPDKIPPTIQKADSRPVLKEDTTSNPPDKIPATFQKADSRPLLKEKTTSNPPDKIPPTIQKADSRPVLKEVTTSNPPDKIPPTIQKADSRPVLKEKTTSNPPHKIPPTIPKADSRSTSKEDTSRLTYGRKNDKNKKPLRKINTKRRWGSRKSSRFVVSSSKIKLKKSNKNAVRVKSQIMKKMLGRHTLASRISSRLIVLTSKRKLKRLNKNHPRMKSKGVKMLGKQSLVSRGIDEMLEQSTKLENPKVPKSLSNNQKAIEAVAPQPKLKPNEVAKPALLNTHHFNKHETSSSTIYSSVPETPDTCKELNIIVNEEEYYASPDFSPLQSHQDHISQPNPQTEHTPCHPPVVPPEARAEHFNSSTPEWSNLCTTVESIEPSMSSVVASRGAEFVPRLIKRRLSFSNYGPSRPETEPLRKRSESQPSLFCLVQPSLPTDSTHVRNSSTSIDSASHLHRNLVCDDTSIQVPINIKSEVVCEKPICLSMVNRRDTLKIPKNDPLTEHFYYHMPSENMLHDSMPSKGKQLPSTMNTLDIKKGDQICGFTPPKSVTASEQFQTSMLPENLVKIDQSHSHARTTRNPKSKRPVLSNPANLSSQKIGHQATGSYTHPSSNNVQIASSSFNDCPRYEAAPPIETSRSMKGEHNPLLLTQGTHFSLPPANFANISSSHPPTSTPASTPSNRRYECTPSRSVNCSAFSSASSELSFTNTILSEKAGRSSETRTRKSITHQPVINQPDSNQLLHYSGKSYNLVQNINPSIQMDPRNVKQTTIANSHKKTMVRTDECLPERTIQFQESMNSIKDSNIVSNQVERSKSDDCSSLREEALLEKSSQCLRTTISSQTSKNIAPAKSMRSAKVISDRVCTDGKPLKPDHSETLFEQTNSLPNGRPTSENLCNEKVEMSCQVEKNRKNQKSQEKCEVKANDNSSELMRAHTPETLENHKKSSDNFKITRILSDSSSISSEPAVDNVSSLISKSKGFEDNNPNPIPDENKSDSAVKEQKDPVTEMKLSLNHREVPVTPVVPELLKPVPPQTDETTSKKDHNINEQSMNTEVETKVQTVNNYLEYESTNEGPSVLLPETNSIMPTKSKFDSNDTTEIKVDKSVTLDKQLPLKKDDPKKSVIPTENCEIPLKPKDHINLKENLDKPVCSEVEPTAVSCSLNSEEQELRPTSGLLVDKNLDVSKDTSLSGSHKFDDVASNSTVHCVHSSVTLLPSEPQMKCNSNCANISEALKLSPNRTHASEPQETFIDVSDKLDQPAVLIALGSTSKEACDKLNEELCANKDLARPTESMGLCSEVVINIPQSQKTESKVCQALEKPITSVTSQNSPEVVELESLNSNPHSNLPKVVSDHESRCDILETSRPSSSDSNTNEKEHIPSEKSVHSVINESVILISSSDSDSNESVDKDLKSKMNEKDPVQKEGTHYEKTKNVKNNVLSFSSYSNRKRKRSEDEKDLQPYKSSDTPSCLIRKCKKVQPKLEIEPISPTTLDLIKRSGVKIDHTDLQLILECWQEYCPSESALRTSTLTRVKSSEVIRKTNKDVEIRQESFSRPISSGDSVSRPSSSRQFEAELTKTDFKNYRNLPNYLVEREIIRRQMNRNERLARNSAIQNRQTQAIASSSRRPITIADTMMSITHTRPTIHRSYSRILECLRERRKTIQSTESIVPSCKDFINGVSRDVAPGCLTSPRDPLAVSIHPRLSGTDVPSQVTNIPPTDFGATSTSVISSDSEDGSPVGTEHVMKDRGKFRRKFGSFTPCSCPSPSRNPNKNVCPICRKERNHTQGTASPLQSSRTPLYQKVSNVPKQVMNCTMAVGGGGDNVAVPALEPDNFIKALMALTHWNRISDPYSSVELTYDPPHALSCDGPVPSVRSEVSLPYKKVLTRVTPAMDPPLQDLSTTLLSETDEGSSTRCLLQKPSSEEAPCLLEGQDTNLQQHNDGEVVSRSQTVPSPCTVIAGPSTVTASSSTITTGPSTVPAGPSTVTAGPSTSLLPHHCSEVGDQQDEDMSNRLTPTVQTGTTSNSQVPPTELISIEIDDSGPSTSSRADEARRLLDKIVGSVNDPGIRSEVLRFLSGEPTPKKRKE